MDDEDESKKGAAEGGVNEGGVTQIPLIETLVFDASLPLKPPPRPARNKDPGRTSYSPDYDPDTIDLFENDPGEPNISTEASVASEPGQSAGHLIDDLEDDLLDEHKQELGHRLRAELTEQLSAILEELDNDDDQT